MIVIVAPPVGNASHFHVTPLGGADCSGNLNPGGSPDLEGMSGTLPSNVASHTPPGDTSSEIPSQLKEMQYGGRYVGLQNSPGTKAPETGARWDSNHVTVSHDTQQHCHRTTDTSGQPVSDKIASLLTIHDVNTTGNDHVTLPKVEPESPGSEGGHLNNSQTGNTRPAEVDSLEAVDMRKERLQEDNGVDGEDDFHIADVHLQCVYNISDTLTGVPPTVLLSYTVREYWSRLASIADEGQYSFRCLTSVSNEVLRAHTRFMEEFVVNRDHTHADPRSYEPDVSRPKQHYRPLL